MGHWTGLNITQAIEGSKQQLITFLSQDLGKDYFSKIAQNSLGVPQGSILGPTNIWFILMILQGQFIVLEDLKLFSHAVLLSLLKSEVYLSLKLGSFGQLSALFDYFSDINLNKIKCLFITPTLKKLCLVRAHILSPSVVVN